MSPYHIAKYCLPTHMLRVGGGSVGQSACLPTCKCYEGCGFESRCCPLTTGSSGHRCAPTCLQTERKLAHKNSSLGLKAPIYLSLRTETDFDFNQLSCVSILHAKYSCIPFEILHYREMFVRSTRGRVH